jgi:hypothetical protein
MGETHVVQQGECLTAIAARYGFADAKAIYEAPENAAYRQLRPDPHVILPGDRIVIPDRKKKSETLATGKRHRIVVTLPQRHLRLKLQLAPGDSLEGEPFELSVGGQTIRGSVGGENAIEADVPADESAATLLLTKRNLKLRLAIGHLDPVRDGAGGELIPSGVQARLHNLGFLAGVGSGSLDDETTAALRRFQAAVLGRAEPDGAPDDETLQKLVEAHGC